MKKFFQVSILAAVAVMSVSSLSSAKSNPPAGHAGNICFVNHDVTQQMPANQFFNWVAQQSRQGVCTYGKLDYEPGSGRMYVNGTAVARGTTNRQGRSIGAGNCQVYTCFQSGPVGNDTSAARTGSPVPPTGAPQPPTSGWN